MTHILRIDASMRSEGSTTRALTDQVIDQAGAVIRSGFQGCSITNTACEEAA